MRCMYLERSEGCVTNMHVTVNKIRSCDRTMVVLKALSLVYDSVIVL